MTEYEHNLGSALGKMGREGLTVEGMTKVYQHCAPQRMLPLLSYPRDELVGKRIVPSCVETLPIPATPRTIIGFVLCRIHTMTLTKNPEEIISVPEKICAGIIKLLKTA